MPKRLSHIFLAALFTVAYCCTEVYAAKGGSGGLKGGGGNKGGRALGGGGGDAGKSHNFSGNSGDKKINNSFSGQSVRQTQIDQGFRKSTDVKVNAPKNTNININNKNNNVEINKNNEININSNNKNNNNRNNNSRGVAVIGDDRGVIAGNNGGVAWGKNGGAVWGENRGVVAGENGAIAIGPHGAVIVTDNNRGLFDHDHFYVHGGPFWVYDVDWHGHGVFHSCDDYWKFVAGTTLILAFGVMLATLPDNSDTVIVEGDTYYYNNNTYYQEVADQGEIVYEVIPPPIGAVVVTLPPDCSKLEVNSVTYYVTPDKNTYYMPQTGGYIVVVKP